MWKNLFKHHLHLSKVQFRACTGLQVPFSIHLPLLWCVAPVSLSTGAVETPVRCVQPPWWATTAPLHVGKLWLSPRLPAGLCPWVVPSVMGSSYDFLASLLQLLFYPSPTALLLFYSLLWCMFINSWWHGNNPELFCPTKCWRSHLIRLGHLQNWQCISKGWAWKGLQGHTDLHVVLDQGEMGKTTGKYKMLWNKKAQVLYRLYAFHFGYWNAEYCEWCLPLDAFILPIKISLLAEPESRTFTGHAEEVNVNGKFGISSGVHGNDIPKPIVNGGI